MKVAVIGGGVLGLTLAYRLAGAGHEVELFEAAPELGGLAAAHDYGPFVWDRFYHCILPTDRHLIGLLEELGLAGELRWRRTGTGYHAGGRTYPMSGNGDFLRFPLLSLRDKARLAATVVYATRFADPWQLYRISARDWLVRMCGQRGYEVFWQPLLRAKFGPYHDQIAAVFIWATLTRLFGARTGAGSKEKLGYCRGGYQRILGALEARIRAAGGAVHTSAPVRTIRRHGSGCAVVAGTGELRTTEVDQVFFTAPTQLLRGIADADFQPYIDRFERQHPTASAYLGVACLVLVLRRPLTPYYVLNIGDPRIELTGLIEMSNLVDRDEELAGYSLVYLPRYLDSGDPELSRSTGEQMQALMDRGVARLFPELDRRDLVYAEIHRAGLVQPLPLVRSQTADRGDAPAPLARPLHILNTALLTCATLNNNEVVALVDRFLQQNQPPLRG
jgi:protoporphyrinogen oxidase